MFLSYWLMVILSLFCSILFAFYTFWGWKHRVSTVKPDETGPWVNRNTVHSALNFKSPVFSLIIFVKNHWINRTLHIPNSALTCGPNTLITVIIYLRKPIMIRSIKRVFTYMWISIGSKGKRIESVYRSVYISTPVISDHW